MPLDGAITDSLIPRLTELASANITFSGNNGTTLNGMQVVMGAEFTAGSLVAQTSGVAIDENFSSSTFRNSNMDEFDYFPGCPPYARNGMRQHWMKN